MPQYDLETNDQTQKGASGCRYHHTKGPVGYMIGLR